MPLIKNNTHCYQVKKAYFLNETIYAVELQSLGDPMWYIPGQLCKIYCSDAKGRYFSIINNEISEKCIKIHLRINKNKSEALKELTKPGSRVQVEGPYGEMHKLLQMKKTKILLAEGLGLSAFHSLLDHSNDYLEKIHLIWIRGKIDNGYSNEKITNWQKKLSSFYVYELESEEYSLSHCLDYCKDIIEKNKEVVLAFAGSLQTSKSIQDKFISNQDFKTVEFLSDVA